MLFCTNPVGVGGYAARSRAWRLSSTMYTPVQMHTESSEPAGAARPMQYRVSGKRREESHAPGTRTNIMERALCTNETSESPYALKNPLNAK